MDSAEFDIKYIPLSNGETYAYREIGASPDIIILLHGNMSSSKFYDILAQILAKEFRVICPDMRGFGHSTYNKRVTDHQDLAEDLKLFVDSLGIMRFSILGWSTGGGVASTIAAKYPEYVQNLFLLCSLEPKGSPLYKINPANDTKEYYTKPEEFSSDPKAIYVIDLINRKDTIAIKRLFNTLVFNLKKPNESRYDTYIDEIMLQRHYDHMLYANHFFNITNEDTSYSKGLNIAKNIKAKTLILHGDKDMLISPSDNWFKLLGEDKAKWKIFKNCGHGPMEDCLEELTEAIINFIKAP